MCPVGSDSCPLPPPESGPFSSGSSGEGRFHRKGDSLVSLDKPLSAVNRIDVGLYERVENLESGGWTDKSISGGLLADPVASGDEDDAG